MNESSLFNDYYGNFDDILLKEKSAWYGGSSRDELIKAAVKEGLALPAAPYGETRKINFAHLLFGGKLPAFLGFDLGPIKLPGNRATITQGQIFKNAGRTTTFSPSFRFIADLATNEIHTVLPGGVSDRRFGKLYSTDLGNWLKGEYKVLR